eukprot:UN03522
MINQLRERILAEAFPNALHELVGLAILSIPSRGDAPITRSSTNHSAKSPENVVVPAELTLHLDHLHEKVDKQSEQIDLLIR